MRRLRLLIVAVAVGVASIAPAGAQAPASTTIFRVFLTDGTSLASYGEWVRVHDRVVFSMPLSASPSPDLHLVSIPSERVDWPRTEGYARAARAEHYAATRGEADFARLSTTIAQTLNDVALEKDPKRRLEIAERARRALADWPGGHFNYRERDVRDIVGMLDEVIGELRAAAGLSRFDLALSASTPPEPLDVLLPPSSGTEVIDELMLAARLTETPAERVSLLRTVLTLIDRAVGSLPDVWASLMRRTALARIAEEERLDAEYANARTATLERAGRLAARADVRGLERLRATLAGRYSSLTSRRPSEMAALVATVDAQLEGARQLRLAQDQWRLRAAGYQSYQRAMGIPLKTLAGASTSLEDIRAMAGPTPQTLEQLAARLTSETPRIDRMSPPAELQGVHALFRSAWELAASAVRLRLDAAAANSLEQARHASSAAAGALMLLTRARAELDIAVKPPTRQLQ